MIVIGVDVHKHSLTAVAVDEAARMLDGKTVAAANDELLSWASELDGERLWALEDCRQLTRWLERQLLERGEQLVRVPPKLVAPERRAGRARGKSDPIDALAVARAALPEPDIECGNVTRVIVRACLPNRPLCVCASMLGLSLRVAHPRSRQQPSNLSMRLDSRRLCPTSSLCSMF